MEDGTKSWIINKAYSRHKAKQDRVAILLTCGTEKLKPLFTHKYQTPRPLKGIDKSTLPVDYYWNSKAWMQLTIWNDYLKNLNNKMHLENRNIFVACW